MAHRSFASHLSGFAAEVFCQLQPVRPPRRCKQGARTALLDRCRVPFTATISFAAANVQSLLVLSQNLDGAVMVIQLERRWLVRHHVLAAQLRLNGSERGGDFGDL